MTKSPEMAFAALDAPMAALEQIATSLRGTGVEESARVFQTNAQTALTLATMPAALLIAAYADAALVTASEAFLGTLPPDQRARALAMRDDLTANIHDKLKADVAPKVRQLLSAVADREPLASTLQALMRAVVVQTWTGFECLASDVWVSALNADFTLGQNALAADAPADMPEGLSRKSVSVAVLGQYRFDLSRKMGTVLREKFHFGSCDGMETAYAAAFGKADGRRVFRANDLLQLEATRHLIVHRGGIVDPEYRKKLPNSPEAVGQHLALATPRVSAHMATGVQAGVRLLEFAATLAVGRARADGR